MKIMRTVACLTWVALGCMAAGCEQGGKPAASRESAGTRGEAAMPPPAHVTDTTDGAPREDVPLAIKDLAGIQQFVAAQKGKIVVMDVWSTTCAPCVKEFPGLVQLDRRHRSDGVTCLSVSSDYLGIADEKLEDHRPAVEKFLRSQGATFENVLSSTPDTELYKALNIGSIPAVFVYQRDGQLAKVFGGSGEEGFSYAEEIIPFVEGLLASKEQR